MDNNEKKTVALVLDPYSFLVFIVFTFIPFVAWVFGFGPKQSSRSLFSYIDFKTCSHIEEKECLISFGHVFFLKKIQLPKTSSDSKVLVSCKPLGRQRRGLPSDCFEYIKKNTHYVVCLLKNQFFDEKEVEIVYLYETTHIGEDFKNNISERERNGIIEIINNNYHEIKGYPYKLPDTFNFENVHELFNEFEYMETAITDSEREIIIYLDLPPRVGDQPGRKSIPLTLS